MGASKKRPDDFYFYQIIGEGSFSVVYLARDVQTKQDCAAKVCEKSHIYRERMHKAILREKNIMSVLTESESPFIIRLFATFQDETRLYFILNYCINGELLSFINQREIFNASASLFYAAETLVALEHLHKLGIIHRDLKPENILLNDKMHIQITDFGSALMLNDPTVDLNDQRYNSYRNRKNSFVGTAQYVSPEMLTNKKITPMCDLWAWACILYQMITNKPPFTSGNEYLIFQKIQNLEYTFPDNFPSDAKHLIESILKIDFNERLGAQDDISLEGGYTSIRNHPYFESLNNNWDMINREPPAQLLAVAKTESSIDDSSIELLEPGLNEKQIARLLGLALHEETNSNRAGGSPTKKGLLDISPKEFEERLEKQKESNKFHQFVENNLILKQGFIDKKKGFFPRRRMFLLTTGPHLYYVDPANMVLKGQVPFCKEMRTEAKNFRNFYVHVPNRTYILEDTSNSAPSWCDAIDEVKSSTFPETESSDSPQPSTSTGGCTSGRKSSSRSNNRNSLFNIHIRKMGLVEKSN